MFENQLKTEISEIDKKIAYLQKNTSNVRSDLSGALSRVNNLATVATSGDYNDLLNKPTVSAVEFDGLSSSEAKFNHIDSIPSYNTNGTLNGGEIFFLCSLDTYITGTFDIQYHSYWSAGFDVTFNIYLNGIVVQTKTVNVTSNANTLSLDFEYFPKQKNNVVRFEMIFPSAQLVMIERVETKISAKNIFFLSRDYTKTVFVYKHKYYIGENYKRQNKYYVLSADNFNLDTPLTPEYDTGSCQIVFPKASYYDVIKFNESVVYMISRETFSRGMLMQNTQFSLDNFTEFPAYGYGVTYFREASIVRDDSNISVYSSHPPATAVFESTKKLGYWDNDSDTVRTIYQEYKLNGEPIECGHWVENVPVHQLDMTNAPITVFQGSVGVRDDGQCFFFPHFNMTYYLPLDFGRRPSVFRQENGDIHIYLGRINHVLKIVLVKNSTTNQYEIASKTKIYGCDEYYETLDNKAVTLSHYELKLIDA